MNWPLADALRGASIFEWLVLVLCAVFLVWMERASRWPVYEAWRREPSAKQRERNRMRNIGGHGRVPPMPMPNVQQINEEARQIWLNLVTPQAGRCPHCGASLGHGRPGSMNPAGPPPIPPRPPR